MSPFHFCLSAAKNLSSFQQIVSPAFLSHRLIGNSRILAQAGVNLPDATSVRPKYL